MIISEGVSMYKYTRRKKNFWFVYLIMALICRCGQAPEAFGLPDCNTKMAPIVRMIFTTRANQSIIDPVSALQLVPTNPTFPDIYALVTPRLHDVSSERGEPVTEEIGATTFFVRNSARTVTAILAQVPAEFGEYITALRCQNQVGVFFVDANGVVWGAKLETILGVAGAPIPVIPSTISANFGFASYSTVQKYTITFQVPFEWEDYELIPLVANQSYLTYVPPQPVGWRIYNPTMSGAGTGWRVYLYVKYAVDVPYPSPVPITNAAPLAQIRILADDGVTLVAQANSNAGSGFYVLNNPLTSGQNYILDCRGVTTPPATAFDWNGLRARFRAP